MCEQVFANCLAEYLKKVEENKGKRVFAMFAGNTDENTGDSWCSDCRNGECSLRDKILQFLKILTYTLPLHLNEFLDLYLLI